MTTPARLTLRHVAFSFEGDAPIASDWSCSIPAGATLLHGDTGSGKTTLLRMLAGELACEGSITLSTPGAAASAHGPSGVASPDPIDRSPHERSVDLAIDGEAYRRLVFFVDPWSDRFDAMTPRECAAALNHGDAFDEAEWQTLVGAFALQPHMHKSLFMLSTGSKRKVWLAAALATSRPLVLLDEPTAALDAPSVEALWAALTRAKKKESRVIVVATSDVPTGVPFTGRIDLPLQRS